MKKLSLSILTVLCAVCFAFGVGLIANVNYASADVAGGAPVLSETRVMRSKENDKMLLATAIKNYNDVYEVGYNFTGDVTATIAEKYRFYTSIETGSKSWTAEAIFGNEFADAGLIVWEIEFEIGDSYEFKPYAIYGDRNEQGQLVASGYEVTPESSTVKQFFTVTFTTHDGSEVLSSKVYQKGAEIVAPENGTTYTVGGDKFEIFYDEMKNAGVSTANESATYKVFSEICVPDGMGKGYIHTYGDAGPEKPTENTYVSIGAHTTLGNFSTALNNEKLLYRERSAGAGLDHGSNLTFYYAPNSVMTKMYLGFYIESGDSIDMSFRLYAGSMTTCIPVTFVDGNGNEVAKADLQNGTWYTAIYDLTQATAIYGQRYKLTLAGTNSTIKTVAYIRAPYFGLADGVSVSDFDNIKDDLGRGFMGIESNSHVVNYVENGELVSKITNGTDYKTPFSTEIANEYIAAQSEGGKVLRFDVKFTGTATYNGYVKGVSYAMSNTIRGNRRYVRFYDTNGTEVNYDSLQVDVWYKMIFDIDTIKSDVCEQTISTGTYAGLSPRIYANNAGNTISIKNVEIVAKANENA